mmetsp:Transcript_57700/g.153791  ORF Transcript_57700/g.153791 Transcript_57700/m.153791 type:complete len:631 (-) Transcript_57700:143-2035(-)
MAKVVRSIPPLPSTERGQFTRLTTDPAGDRIIYCNGNGVYFRNVASVANGAAGETPDDVFCWRGHTKKTTMAAMSPNGNWMVSGDVGGAIRVWGAKGEHVQKNEYRLWDGAVLDGQWSGDSTRVVACGDGNQDRAVAIIAETGSRTGVVAGHTKQINSISFKSERPFRIMTGSEDMSVIFHEGPPFKFNRSHTAHSNFVNTVRYSPNCEWAFSAGSDSKLVLYSGKDGDLVKEFDKPDGISGTIWGAAWSPDGLFIATAGGDKKLRIWSREAGAQVSEQTVGAAALQDMLVGVCWPKQDQVVTVALDGRLHSWQVTDGNAQPMGITDGTQGPLTCLGYDPNSRTYVSGGPEGSIGLAADGQPVSHVKVGKGVNNILTHGASNSANEIYVSSLDDCVRCYTNSGELQGAPIEIKEFVVGMAWLESAEKMLVVAGGKNSLLGISGGAVAWSKAGAFPRRPTAVASLPGALLAVALEMPEGIVGGVATNKFDIVLYGVSDPGSFEGLSEKAVLESHKFEVTTMKISPNGRFLASADASKNILVWGLDQATVTVAISAFAYHTARVTGLDWLPGSTKLVSGSLDQTIFVWNTEEPTKPLELKEAHKGGVGAVVSASETEFASVGNDGYLTVHGI